MAEKRSQTKMLLMLLAVLMGAGGWNYNRNLQVEKQEHRPYRAYSDADLAKLAAAYQTEVDTLTQRFQRATGSTVPITSGGLIGEQVREFERVQNLSRSTRAIIDALAKNQVQLDLVEDEIARRAADASAIGLHVRRLTQLP